ncbi:MAG TPA: two-component regulator propeller domain-containing protein, partial [Bacteroidota bacterium]|nr:two-component regulator propeller domain-containing protein [Bacteroidota bacterium]
MRRLVSVVLWSSVVGLTVHARQSSIGIGQWKNFTDMKSARAIAANSGALWAATEGGTFSYHDLDSTFNKFTNSDGISSNDLTAITVDQSGAVWVGAYDGSVNVFEVSWREIRDIAVSNRIQRSIKKFVQRGDSMFVASDFGVSVYRMSKREFGDTYSNFGFSSPALVNSVLIQGNRIWVATTQGLATALRSSINLTSPTSWTTYGLGNGLPSLNVKSTSLFNDTLVAGTANGAAFFSADTFLVMSALAGRSIVDLEEKENLLYALSNAANSYVVEVLGQLGGTPQLVSSNSGTQGNDLLTSPTSSKLWVSTSTLGIAQWDGSSWTYISPNGPQSNLFVSVAVDKNGVLWAGTGINGRGFSRYDQSPPGAIQWKNFTNASYPILGSDSYYKVSIADNSVWLSSWGAGVVEVVADTIRRRLHTTSTPSLATSDVSDPNYPVIGSVAVDLDGSSWFVNRTAQNGNVLAQLVNDTTFVYYRNMYNPSEGIFTNLVIDREGTKWLANSEPGVKNARGFYYFNERKTVSGTEITDGWGFMSTSEGLPNASVVSLAVDASGDVWIGTDLGVMIITDPRFPRTRRTSSFPLREQSVQAIAVDGVNNKW